MRWAWGHKCDVCGRRILGRGMVMVSLEILGNIVEGLPREVAVHRHCLRPIKPWPEQTHEALDHDPDDEPLVDILGK